jgi:hypothetical protein
MNQAKMDSERILCARADVMLQRLKTADTAVLFLDHPDAPRRVPFPHLFTERELHPGAEPEIWAVSLRTAIAALRPLMPITLPPGCVQAPHR